MRQHWFARARSLAIYVASDGEIDPSPLIRAALAAGKRVLLPRLRHNRLEFVVYCPGGLLRRNRFGIPEPRGVAVAVEQIDVIFMPLVGFDRAGRRLGMGGGFYDRTLARKKRRGTRLIGLAHACQEVSQLPDEAWDVPLTGVVTERRWLRAH